jgi:putative membrane-bound dehydrogenase-like protein
VVAIPTGNGWDWPLAEKRGSRAANSVSICDNMVIIGTAPLFVADLLRHHMISPALKWTMSFAIVGLGTSSMAHSQQPLSAGGFTILGQPPGKVQSQDMAGFGPKWQESDQLWWTGGKPGDRLNLVVPLKDEGTYELSVVLTKAPDYAIVQLYWDGKKVGERIDLYDPKVIASDPIPLGTHRLTRGNHSLGIEIVGANPKAAKTYMVGVDVVLFRPANDPQASAFSHPKSIYPYASLSPEAAARAMRLPKGFSVQVAAAEPDVKQPIAMAIDDRGRLWVAEAYTYPQRAPEGKGKDRILIFEDTDGDGKFDKRTVFIENLNLVSGLEVGFGGVWVGAAPYLLFIPDRDGDDRPDGPPQILLDGWGYEDTHETLNTFIWGPDGWLYGCHGVFTHSKVGKPGTPNDQRLRINAGIWRYHPVRHKFEVFAEGTSNPWGIDFNDYGQAFCTACVIPHLFHIVQGARYDRQAGMHFNPFTYGDIPTIADHLHYLGNQWNNNDRKRSDELGGGHAHAGAMIYLGGSWPTEYRNQIFMNNIHGNRINLDFLKPKGSSYVGSHGPDFILTDDQSSQILNLRYGPDGQVWMIDWYDRNQCHHGNPDGHDRSNGRIFRVSHNGAKPVRVDLAKLTDRELVKAQGNKNDWYVRHARRLLYERAAAGKLDPKVRGELIDIIRQDKDETRRLRALWVLHVTGGLTEPFARQLLADAQPHVRAWTIQVWMENRPKVSPEILTRFTDLARNDLSPVVRLYLASAVQKLPLAERWPILEGLVSHSEDAADHNLPLMYWYAMEPLASEDMRRALALGLVGGENIPLLRNFMVRRIGGANTDKSLQLLVEGLGEAKTPALQLAFLRGMNQALVGRRQVEPPAGWAKVYPRVVAGTDAQVRGQALALAVTFGDKEAMATLHKIMLDAKADVPSRQQALSVLLEARSPGLAADLQGLVMDKNLRGEALRGLAAFDDPRSVDVILKKYGEFSLSDKRDALSTLCSRASYGQALLTAIHQKHVPARDLTADLVRQLRELKDAALDQRIAAIWGSVRDTSADMAKLIAQYRKMLKTPPPKAPEPSLGRTVFARTCQQCHTLYGVGGKVGPDITGSNRADLDYLLSNILDPSAVMAKEYQPSIIITTSGRVITGIVKDQSANAVTLQTANDLVVVPRKEIDEMRQSPQSMMPNDLLTPLSEHEVRSLIGYLSGRQQVPMMESKK